MEILRITLEIWFYPREGSINVDGKTKSLQKEDVAFRLAVPKRNCVLCAGETCRNCKCTSLPTTNLQFKSTIARKTSRMWLKTRISVNDNSRCIRNSTEMKSRKVETDLSNRYGRLFKFFSNIFFNLLLQFLQFVTWWLYKFLILNYLQNFFFCNLPRTDNLHLTR